MTNRALWLTVGTAHRPGEMPNVEIWATKPRVHGDGTITGRLLASVCALGFTRATGLLLRTGDVQKVRFSVEKLDNAPHPSDPTH